MNIRNFIKFFAPHAIALLMLYPFSDALSQQRRRTVAEHRISGTVIDVHGEPVANAVITANEGAAMTISDEAGQFSITGRTGWLLVEATGFESFSYPIRIEESITVILQVANLFAGNADIVRLPMGVVEKQRYLVGAVGGVSGDVIVRQPDPLLHNTLQGRIPGLFVDMQTGGLGNNEANLIIRGNSRNSGNGIVFLVDGVERDINTLLLTEIESVQVMKDATSKILYGSRAANGVLSVTTKRGKMHTRVINATTEFGIGIPIAYPKYLSSFDYAYLYNEARNNDGLPPIYSAADLEGYRNSRGANDIRYPDVDYLDYFLSKTGGYRKVAAEFSGGNENTQYAVVVGYNGNTGLQKVGVTPTRDWYNVRVNLDMKVNDFLSASIGIAGVYDATHRGAVSHATTFEAIRNTRPNEFPLIIDTDYLPLDSVGNPSMGASYDQNLNLYERLMYGGTTRENHINGQLNLGLRYDLSPVVSGLSLRANLGFDNYFYGQENMHKDGATFASRWYFDPVAGEDVVMFEQIKVSRFNDRTNLNNSHNLRTTTYLFGVDFLRSFNENSRISANLFINYLMSEETGQTANLQNSNTALRTNYTLKDRYIAEITVARMGSDKFPENNRYFMSYDAGLGWIVSQEGFLSSNNNINFLKIKASGGLLGYDAQTSWNLHRTHWENNGNYRMRTTGTNPTRTALVHLENKNLKWETALEFNFGIEALMLNRKLWAEVNLFHETRSDIITSLSSLYPATYGGMYAQDNLQKVRNQGIDFELRYTDRSGDFFYSAAFVGMYSKNKLLAHNEINHPVEERRSIGRPTDAMFGYVAKGLFGKDVALEGAPHQTLGYYTTGDIAYEDLNGDNRIDPDDRKMLGNSFPRVNLGLDLDFIWKGFGINVLAVSRLGVHSWLNNHYYWNYGDRNFSDQAMNRYHPVNNPQGTYPRLTSLESPNNFENSTFWLSNSSFFRLKNVELSYTFGHKNPMPGVIKSLKIFTRGTNVFTVSKIKELDPEALNAGVSNYPLFSTYTAGVSVVF